MSPWASPNSSDFIWKMTLLDQTVSLKLGSCSSLEMPRDKWSDRAPDLSPLARAALGTSEPKLPSRKPSFTESVLLLQKETLKAMRPETDMVVPAPGGVTPCSAPGGTCQSSQHTETEERPQGPLQSQQEEGHLVFWCAGRNFNWPLVVSPKCPLSALHAQTH